MHFEEVIKAFDNYLVPLESQVKERELTLAITSYLPKADI